MSATDNRDTSASRRNGTTAGQDPSTVIIISVAATAVGLIALIVALTAGGAVAPQVIPGLPDAGPLTRWGLPVAKNAMDVAAVLTVGLLVLAAFLLPNDNGTPSAQALGYVRVASWTALAWAAAAGATLVFQLSDTLGQPVAAVIGDQLSSYAGQNAQGIGLTVVILLSTAVAMFARTVASVAGTIVLVGVSLAAVVPPALTGHSATAGSHELAITGLALHVLAICLWVGGLAAVTYHALRPGGEHVAVAVRRFSRFALWAYIGVAIGGAASAISRLYGVQELVTTEYGLIIVVKIVLFGVLGYFGWLHRRRVVAGMGENGGRARFVRIAGGEIVVMAAVVGLSVALSRTAPPPPAESEVDPVTALLGFPMPPPMSAETLLTLWRPDLLFIMVVVGLGGLYAAGVVRLFRRGDRWPWGRSIAWAAGLLVIVTTVLSGVGTYAMVLFSTHMLQHMLLSMMAPVLLVLGAPATLALRALKPAQRRGDRGPREWLSAFLASPFVRVVTHPGVATPLFVLGPYALYFTPLFPTLMNDHLGHILMNVHFLASGFLFYWIIVGVDAGPRKIPYLLRILLLLLTMGVHAFFGIAIMMQTEPLAPEYYDQLDIWWSSDTHEDQYTGGGIAWAIGEIPTLGVTIAMLTQWARDEERLERRRQRHSQREGSDDADMDRYNAYLQELDRRSRGER